MTGWVQIILLILSIAAVYDGVKRAIHKRISPHWMWFALLYPYGGLIAYAIIRWGVQDKIIVNFEPPLNHSYAARRTAMVQFFRTTFRSVLIILIGYALLVIGLAKLHFIDADVPKDDPTAGFGLLTMIGAYIYWSITQINMLRDHKYIRPEPEWERLRNYGKQVSLFVILVLAIICYPIPAITFFIWYEKIVLVCGAIGRTFHDPKLQAYAKTARKNCILMLVDIILLPPICIIIGEARGELDWLYIMIWLLAAYGAYFLGYLMFLFHKTIKALETQ